MTQPTNNVMNYSKYEHDESFKDQDQIPSELIKPHPNGNNVTPAGYPPRPPLTRIDSRNSFPVRPGFPQGVPNRPPPQQIRQPPPGTPFLQRPPGVPSRPPFQPPFPNNQVVPNLQHQIQGQPRPLRPGAPIRGVAPGPRPPGLVQQRSEEQRIEREALSKSQTLDLPESANIKPISPSFDGNDSSTKNIVKAGPGRIDNNVINSAIMNTTEDQKKPFSRNSSIEEKRIMSSSQESLDRRSEHEYPSRPSSRMSQIMENDNTPKIFSRPSSASDPRPESRNSSNTNQPLLSSSNSIKEDFNSRPSSAIDPRSESRNSLSSKPPLPRSTNPMIEDFKENSSNKAPFPTIKSDKMNSEESNRSSLQLKNLSKAKSPIPIEGDNDSGVDETTQGNDQSSNGDATSPRKSSAKPLKRISSATPSKSRSLSRDSKSPSLKSPDSTATTPGATEKKKLPMNRIQVGSAPSPNLKEVRSKIGSLQNTTYRPGGGNVKIENKKIDLKNVTPRIEAKNDKYMPKGGEKKILSQKLQWNAKSKIGSLENASHKPVSSGKKIETVKLDFKEKAKPKVGSKDNMKHVPGGGDIKIEHKKLDFQVQSKVGSLDNVKHKPKGGDKKIFDDKDYLRQMSAVSSENHSMSGSQNSLPSQPDASRDADENLNQHH